MRWSELREIGSHYWSNTLCYMPKGHRNPHLCLPLRPAVPKFDDNMLKLPGFHPQCRPVCSMPMRRALTYAAGLSTTATTLVIRTTTEWKLYIYVPCLSMHHQELGHMHRVQSHNFPKKGNEWHRMARSVFVSIDQSYYAQTDVNNQYLTN